MQQRTVSMQHDTEPGRNGGEAGANRPIRILVAEDHDDTRDALKLLLELDGYEVSMARDGQEALGVALDWRPDIVITDFDMPRMDGASLAHALRSMEQRVGPVPIIVLTALGWSLVQRAIEAGADLHIPKPVDFQVLGATITEIVGRLEHVGEAEAV